MELRGMVNESVWGWWVKMKRKWILPLEPTWNVGEILTPCQLQSGAIRVCVLLQ